MSDLISRKALLNHLSSWQMEQFAEVGHEKEYNLLDMVIRGIENEPSAQQWIPVEERLPEPNKAVLVSTNTGEVDVDYYGTYCRDFIGLKGTHMKPNAWMPLPEAYKGE